MYLNLGYSIFYSYFRLREKGIAQRCRTGYSLFLNNNIWLLPQRMVSPLLTARRVAFLVCVLLVTSSNIPRTPAHPGAPAITMTWAGTRTLVERVEFCWESLTTRATPTMAKLTVNYVTATMWKYAVLRSFPKNHGTRYKAFV